VKLHFENGNGFDIESSCNSQAHLTWLTWSRTALIAFNQRCLTNALRSAGVVVVVVTGAVSVVAGGRLSVSSPSTGCSASTPADAVGDAASALICRKALASMVDTLDALDVDEDLEVTNDTEIQKNSASNRHRKPLA